MVADVPATELDFLDDAQQRRTLTKIRYDDLNLNGQFGDYYVIEYAPPDGSPPTRVLVEVTIAISCLLNVQLALEQLLDTNGVAFAS